jgi:acetoin:2,6-dichlorophenolindophenol oxidoreductase subunit beta
VLREGNDVTIVGTLLMVERSLQAAELLAGEGASAEVIDLRWIRPLDIPTIEASVRKTGRLVVVEEQWHEGGWGATVISELAQRGVTFQAPPVAVSLPHDLLIPYSPTLEDEMLPSAERIAAGARTAAGR